LALADRRQAAVSQEARHIGGSRIGRQTARSCQSWCRGPHIPTPLPARRTAERCIAERKLRRRQLIDDRDVEISDLQEGHEASPFGEAQFREFLRLLTVDVLLNR
jgi:hypothetical protein